MVYKPVSISSSISEQTEESAGQKEKEGKQVQDPKRKERRFCLCPLQRESQLCGFIKKSNNSALFNHNCPLLQSQPFLHQFETVPDSSYLFASLTPKSQGSSSTVQDYSTGRLAWMAAGTSISHTFLASERFAQYSNGLIRLGLQYPTMDVNKILPHFSRQHIKRLMERNAAVAFRELFRRYSGRFVNVVFDCGKVCHHNYAAVCICGNALSEKPSFFQLAIAPSTKNDYILFYNQLLSNLKQWSIYVSSVCTDGLTAQIQAITECHQRLQKGLPLGEFQSRFTPFHMPCLNHRINNVIQSVFEKNPQLTGVKNDILAFINQANTKDIHKLLQEYCPTFIESRWLSLQQIVAYIRLHRKVIVENGLLSPQRIKDCLYLEILITPLIELHLFFERHETKLCHAYPALLRSLIQYLMLVRDEFFSSGFWLHVLTECVIQLWNRTLNSSSAGMMLLSYALSDVGRFIFRIKEFPLAYSVQYSPEYSSNDCDNVFLADVHSMYDTFLILFFIRSSRVNKEPSVALILQKVIGSFVPVRCCGNKPAEKETTPQNAVVQTASESTTTTEQSIPTDPIAAAIFYPQKPIRTILKQSTLDEFWRLPPPKKNTVIYQAQPPTERPYVAPPSLTESQLPTSRLSFLFSLPEPPEISSLQARPKMEVGVCEIESAMPSHQPFNLPNFYGETKCELKLIENCKTECRLMPLVYILSLAHQFSEIEQYVETQLEERSNDDEVFGLLDAEQQARFDEYQQALQVSVPQKILPKRLRRAHNDPSDPIIVSDSSTTDEYSSETLEDEEPSAGAQLAEQDCMQPSTEATPTGPDVLPELDQRLTENTYTMQNIPVTHPVYTSDDREMAILHRIQSMIIPCSLEDLQELFRRHICSILTDMDRMMCDALIKQFTKDLTGDDFRLKLSKLDNSKTDEIKQLSAEELIYLHLINCLRFTVCSESESERIFSQCRQICGEQRQSIGPLTLNHTFILRRSKPPTQEGDSCVMHDPE